MIGARPARAMIVEDKKQILKNFRNMTKKQKEEAIEAFAEYAAENVPDVYKRQLLERHALDQSVGIGDYYEKKNNFKSKGNY